MYGRGSSLQVDLLVVGLVEEDPVYKSIHIFFKQTQLSVFKQIQLSVFL
jgi:hypothetical protein